MMFKNIPFNRVEWVTSSFLIITAILTFTAVPAYFYFFGWDWFIFGVFMFYYPATGLSITVGYHRLFSHRSHEASWPLVLFYSIFGAGAFQNSIIEWCSDHRNHHKSTDSDDDPYSASRGFWYSHMGWILIEQDKFQNDFSNVKDLEQSKIIRWQHRNIFLIGAFSGIIAPALLGYLIGGVSSAIGGLVWGGLVRLVFVHHGTFLINSAAHIWGTQPYSEENSSKDSFWLAFLTFGEGYHNFHHTFQADYRNGHKWYHVDPSKWWIGIFSMLRLKSNLKKTPKHSIEVAKLDMKFKKTANKLSSKNIDVSIFEKQVDNYRKSMRACLFEIHKARKELKEAMKNQSESIREKIVEIKLSYKQIKDELRIMFKEMNQQYRGISV